MSIDQLSPERQVEALKMRQRVMAYIERRIVRECVYIPGEPVEESGEGVESKN